MDMLNCSFIPPKDIRALRDLCRYRYKLVCIRTSEKNRIQNSMTVSNISLASIVSDPFGKTATDVMKYLVKLNNEPFDKEYVASLLNKGLKKKADQIIDSITGSYIESDQSFKLDICYKHLDEIDEHIRIIENELITRASQFQSFVDLACLVPGIQTLSAIWIIAEIGTDMSVFSDSKHLTSWAGLTPTNNESAGKKHSSKISKAGVYIKPLLIQCALCAIANKTNTYYKVKYDNIKRRRGHKKAIIAIARMILTAIYNMFSTGETFNPYDLDEATSPKPKKKVLNNTNVLEYLKSQGIDISNIEEQLKVKETKQETQ